MTCTAKKKLENIQIKSFDHRIVTLKKKKKKFNKSTKKGETYKYLDFGQHGN
jgi:hypothetical protein